MITRLLVMSLSFMIGHVATAESLKNPTDALTHHEICRAGIATVMGRDPEIIKVSEDRGQTLILYYVRQDDRSRWEYKCKIDGDRIVWGADDGRWLTHSLDPVLNFSITEEKGVVVVEKYSDGSSKEKVFSFSELHQ